MRRAAVYVRVSTEEQNLENQLAMLRTYALQHDMNVVEVYQEEESAWRGHTCPYRDAEGVPTWPWSRRNL